MDNADKNRLKDDPAITIALQSVKALNAGIDLSGELAGINHR